MKNKTSTDLISGSIWKSILWFSVPLLIGNLFQQLYNTVDSYVVGNYVNANALAAVGQSTPIINTLVGFFMGLATGAGVVISQYYGANRIARMRKAIHASLAVTLVLCLVFTVLGVALANPILTLIGSPKEVLPLAESYLKIFFMGVTFALIYNMGSGILRAIGDSKNPLIFLIIASLVNIVLDFVFVLYFKMGVVGVAIATDIAQGVSAVLVMYKLMTTKEKYRVNLKWLNFNPHIIRRIIAIGFPAALQNSIVSFSNVIVQSYISSFGANAVAGYGTAVKLDGFLQLPIQSFALAITTFVGQNYGARKTQRVKKGIYTTIAMCMLTVVFLEIVMVLKGDILIGFFTNNKAVIEIGYLMIKVFATGYFILPLVHILSGALRGVGLSKVPMYFLVVCFVFLRQIYLFIFTKVSHNLATVFFGWPITWIICAIGLIVYYRYNFHLEND